MQEKLYKITIALAGVVQSASLIKELAQTGKADEPAFEASIGSIFQTDPIDVPTVYKGIQGVQLGLEQLVTMLDSSNAPLQTRYMLAMMHLQKKAFRSSKVLNIFSQRIQQTKKQVDYFSLTHPTVIANLADIYLDAVSIIKFRVIIWGNQHFLSITQNMEKIRALLLAGIRSALLWRQVGGSRLQLIFYRKKIKVMAKKILEDLKTMQ